MIKPSALTFDPHYVVASCRDNNYEILMNTLSTLFPLGEKFFVDSVKHYRASLLASGMDRNCTLNKDIGTFIGHESHHSNAHILVNNLLYKCSFVDPSSGVGLLRFLPKWAALQSTCCLEHYTDLLAKLYFSTLRNKVGSNTWELWDYHAREEIDHRHVAISVARATIGVNRLMFIPVSIVLITAVLILYVRNGGGYDANLVKDLISIVPALCEYGYA